MTDEQHHVGGAALDAAEDEGIIVRRISMAPSTPRVVRSLIALFNSSDLGQLAHKEAAEFKAAREAGLIALPPTETET